YIPTPPRHTDMSPWSQVSQSSVTFHDVAACFSVEEWGSLEEWQKELYRNVMREIHTALRALGKRLCRDALFICPG
uniref:KRAB domain-containing protein n=1 Tax=Leptobrachium leishanense TaxID=445787 RepID=A0A8C5MI91_9ANUR